MVSPRSTHEPRQYETLQAASERLQCTRTYLRQMIASGKLPGFHMGNRSIRVAVADVDALMRPIPAVEANR